MYEPKNVLFSQVLAKTLVQKYFSMKQKNSFTFID